MLFNSFSFILFFILFFIIYVPSGHFFRNIALLIAGIYFYSWASFQFLPLLLFSITINYYAGKWISSSVDGKLKKQIFVLCISINLFVLFLFKYTNFLLGFINDIFLWNLDFRIPILPIVLPLGISFFTFHNISYIMDIYYQKCKPAKTILDFAIYDLFFPLLLAGPIERPANLLPQIESEKHVTLEKLSSGILLFLYGVGKKVLIADQLSFFTENIMNPAYSLPTGIFWWGGLVMAFQVYADFSGYSDCARGLARILGMELSWNFFHPFLASNPVEFWKRWHISLSTWLRDYLYIPLGGNRVGKFRESFHLFLVWSLGGLWHGATYGYLIWGWYSGLQVVLYHWIHFIVKIPSWVSHFKWLGRLGITVSFGLGLLLFKITSVSQILDIVTNLNGFYWNPILLGKIVFLLFPLFLVEAYQVQTKDEDFFKLKEQPLWIVFGVASLFLQMFLLFAVEESKEFFYFQF